MYIHDIKESFHKLKALRRQRQADLCEFKASLVYRASFRTARATQGNPTETGSKEFQTGTECVVKDDLEPLGVGA